MTRTTIIIIVKMVEVRMEGEVMKEKERKERRKEMGRTWRSIWGVNVKSSFFIIVAVFILLFLTSNITYRTCVGVEEN